MPYQSLRTYSRRRNRTIVNPVSLPSSPLQPLPDDEEVNITVAEMTRRMKKRSRHSAYSIPDRGQDVQPDFAEDSQRLTKKLKQTAAGPQIPLEFRCPLNDDMDQDHQYMPLKDQNISDNAFQTPLRSRSAQSMLLSSSNHRMAVSNTGQSSPFSASRLMLSRTSSRNFKENSRNLASPFSSRPVSSTPSPRGSASKSTTKRPRRHAKSRTLSAGANKHTRNDSVSRQAAAVDGFQNVCYNVPTSKSLSSNAHAHARTGSIPVMSPDLLHQIPPEDWFIPGKAIIRPSAESNDVRPDTFPSEHASFFLDTPNHISTPPRRRRATITGRSLNPRFEDSDGNFSDVSAVPSVASSVNASPASPLNKMRQRRRHVEHSSPDSIFSSVLDFSTSNALSDVDETSLMINSIHLNNIELPGVPDPFAADVRFRSASASSPALSYHRRASSSASGNIAGPSASSGGLGLSLHAGIQLAPMVSEADDELGDMFSLMGLDVDEKWRAISADDSGVAFPAPLCNRTRSGSILEPAIEMHADKSKTERTKEQTHRRKRGDTIRASDVLRPASSFDAATDAHPRASPLPFANTRRTRSGTVTRSKSAASTIPTVPSMYPNTLAQKRRHEGWPTIQMKIDDEPLLPQKTGEGDCELLLTSAWPGP